MSCHMSPFYKVTSTLLPSKLGGWCLQGEFSDATSKVTREGDTASTWLPGEQPPLTSQPPPWEDAWGPRRGRLWAINLACRQHQPSEVQVRQRSRWLQPQLPPDCNPLRDPKGKPPLPALEPWKWSRPVVSDSLQPRGPTRLLCPWDSPGNNTGTMRSSNIRSQWPCDRCDQWSDDHYDLKPLSFKVTCQSQWRRRRASEEFLLSCHVVTAELPFFYMIIYPLIKPLLAPIIQLALCQPLKMQKRRQEVLSQTNEPKDSQISWRQKDGKITTVSQQEKGRQMWI